MPYDSNGVFNLVPGYQATTGQTILASQHNPPLEDIAAALSQVLLRSGIAPMLANLNMNSYRITNLANGTAPQDAATYGQLSGVLPISSVLDYAGSSAPSGFLLCFGQEVSRSDYAALFGVIGTTYGAGNGSTTFNVPDLRGSVTAGKDDMGGTDATRLSGFYGAVARILNGRLGTSSHTLNEAQIPAHSHTGFTDVQGAHSHALGAGWLTAGGSFSDRLSRNGPERTSTDGAHSHNVQTNNTGGGQAHPNAQPTLIMNKIIKAI